MSQRSARAGLTRRPTPRLKTSSKTFKSADEVKLKAAPWFWGWCCCLTADCEGSAHSPVTCMSDIGSTPTTLNRCKLKV